MWKFPIVVPKGQQPACGGRLPTRTLSAWMCLSSAISRSKMAMRSSLASLSSSRKRFKISTSFSGMVGWLDAMGVPGGCMSFHHFAGSVGSFLFRWFTFFPSFRSVGSFLKRKIHKFLIPNVTLSFEKCNLLSYVAFTWQFILGKLPPLVKP